MKYKTISLFSGGMGLDLGLDKTNRFELMACVEKDAAACSTIRENQKNGLLPESLVVYEQDINDLNPHELLLQLNIRPGDIDVLVGGPPCQSFSTAGKRRTTQDPRGTLLWRFLHFVEVLEPKMFLMENVRGLLSAALKHRPIVERPKNGGPPLSEDEKKGSVVARFADDLRSLNSSYHLDVFEVNSVNYGAPQIRERVLFIGNRFNSVVDFPEPTHARPSVDSNPSTSAQIDLFDQKSQKLPWKTLRDAIEDLEESSNIEVLDFSPRKKKFLSQVPEGGNWRSLPEEIQKESMGRAWYAKGGRSGWWRRLTYDLPCPTLVTMPNHSSTSLCHPTKIRALSVKEYARIQEFPDAWVFCGKTAEKYKQIGNAVPIRLGHVSGTVICEHLDKLRRNNWIPATEAPNQFRKVYLQSHVRTRKWFQNGSAVVWDSQDNKSQRYSKPKTKTKEDTLLESSQ